MAEVHREMAGKILLSAENSTNTYHSTEQENDIQTCLTEMESCFQLLLPRFDLLPPDFSDPAAGDLGQAEFESSSSDGEEEENNEHQLEEQDEATIDDNLTKDEDKLRKDMPVPKTAEASTSSETPYEDSDDDSEEEWEEVEGGDSDVLQVHGIAGHTYSLTIELPRTVKVIENEENASIISTLKERHHVVVNKFLPAVNKWIQVEGE